MYLSFISIDSLVNEAKWKDDEPRDTYCTIMEGNLQKARTPTCYDKAKPIYSQEYELYVLEAKKAHMGIET